MKLFLALVAFLAMVSAWWIYAGSPSSLAAGSQPVYLPLVTKEAWIDPVNIMQQAPFRRVITLLFISTSRATTAPFSEQSRP